MKALTLSRKKMLEILLSDPIVLSKVLMENELPKTVKIKDDGSIIFGKTKYNWINKLVGCFRQVSLLEVSINIADAITGSGNNRNEEGFDCITKNILDSAIKKQDLDRIVDILFDSMRAGTDGELASRFITEEDIKRFSKDPDMRKRIETGKLDVYGKVRLNSGYCIDVRLNECLKQYRGYTIELRLNDGFSQTHSALQLNWIEQQTSNLQVLRSSRSRVTT